MFEGKRYMTVGVKETVGLDIQIIIWSMIDDIRKKNDFNIDYLQVFELETIEINGFEFQKITHKQEVEPYSVTKVFRVEKTVNCKMFVISNKDEEGQEYSVMMLSHEY